MLLLCAFFFLSSNIFLGSYTECSYEILKHGIPVDDLPMKQGDSKLELDNSLHIEWLRQRQVKKEAKTSTST